MRGAQHGFDSETLRLITPPNGRGCGGSCFEFSDCVAAGEQACDGDCCANTLLAAAPASNRLMVAIRHIPNGFRLVFIGLLHSSLDLVRFL